MAKKQLLTEPVLPNSSIINPDLHYKVVGQKSKIQKNINKMPDQKWHRIVSFIKSGVRIIGYVAIPLDLVAAAVVLIFSEVIGIIEELV
jgi:hypothetical protein